MTKNIVYVGDSVPITGSPNVIELLQQRGNLQVRNCCKSGQTTQVLDAITVGKSEEFLVLHLGIVDASPRILTLKEIEWLKKRPRLGKFVRPILKRLRKTILLIRKPIVYISPNMFYENINTFLSRLSSKKVIVLSIAPITNSVNTNLFLHRRNVNIYNQILMELSDEFGAIFLDTSEIFKGEIVDENFSDGLHWESRLHSIVAQKILDEIEK